VAAAAQTWSIWRATVSLGRLGRHPRPTRRTRSARPDRLALPREVRLHRPRGPAGTDRATRTGRPRPQHERQPALPTAAWTPPKDLPSGPLSADRASGTQA